MDYLPIALDVRDQACLVVGGGEVALRKIDLLQSAGARVRVVTLAAKSGVAELAERGAIELHLRGYESADLDGTRVVIAATNDRDVNSRVAHDARTRGVPVNVVDDPELCSFIVPAIVDRAPITIAISTGGASPVLARLVRARLSALLHPRLGELASFAARNRTRVREQLQDGTARRELWERVLDGDAADHVLAGDAEAADAALQRALDDASAIEGAGTHPTAALPVRIVCIPHAGLEGLTLKALRVIGRVDLIAYAPAGAQAVELFARRDATRLELAPERSERSWHELIAAARTGSRVCLLCNASDAAPSEARLDHAGLAHARVEATTP